MNEVVNKFMLTDDKFMHQLHLRQPEFNYRAYRTFTIHCKWIQNFKEKRIR